MPQLIESGPIEDVYKSYLLGLSAYRPTLPPVIEGVIFLSETLREYTPVSATDSGIAELEKLEWVLRLEESRDIAL